MNSAERGVQGNLLSLIKYREVLQSQEQAEAIIDITAVLNATINSCMKYVSLTLRR